MKILIVRFSSIGDIVLTSPVVRCLKNQLPDIEIHFLSKRKFSDTLIGNPYIDKIWTIEKSTSEKINQLKKENFDYIIDLHHNLRTLQLKIQLNKKSYSFNKLNFRKWLKTLFKNISLPDCHIVDRYMKTIEHLGVKNDGAGLDYFIPDNEKIIPAEFHLMLQKKYIAIVSGGSYFTKQIPINKLREICGMTQQPIVILGGKQESETGEALVREFSHVVNACGKLSLNQSASLIEQCEWIISSDTGLMHIGSAFKKKIISIWGNTVPEFGMSPYLPGENSKIIEVKSLSCRPCSKLGFKSCPKKHFNCMNKIDVRQIFSGNDSAT